MYIQKDTKCFFFFYLLFFFFFFNLITNWVNVDQKMVPAIYLQGMIGFGEWVGSYVE